MAEGARSAPRGPGPGRRPLGPVPGTPDRWDFRDIPRPARHGPAPKAIKVVCTFSIPNTPEQRHRLEVLGDSITTSLVTRAIRLAATHVDSASDGQPVRLGRRAQWGGGAVGAPRVECTASDASRHT